MFWKRYQETLGAVLTAIAVFFLISIAAYNPDDYMSLLENAPVKNIAGPVGAWVGYLIRSVFGSASYGIAGVLALPGLYLLRNRWMRNITEKSVIILFLTINLSSLMSLFKSDALQLSGGYLGSLISGMCMAGIGRTASYILLSALTLCSAIMLVVFFLAPRREQYEITPRFSGTVKKIFGKIRSGKKKDDIPWISVGDAINDRKDRKFPWITKKRIIVYETEAPGSPLDVLPFPALPASSWDRDSEPATCTDTESGTLLLEGSAASSADESEVILSEDDYLIDTTSDTTSGNDTADVVDINFIGEDDAEIASATSETVKTQSDYVDDAEEHEVLEDILPVASARTNTGENLAREGLSEHVFDEIPINEEYIIPTSYLTSSKPLDTESWKKEIHRNSILLKNTLAEFGIEAEVVAVNRGPVITLYEMQIAPGIKVNRVVGLADDIAMALAAQRVRIVAPIPGKSAIGVEIPNLYRETVTLGDIIKSDEFKKHEGHLVVALGKDILGKPVMLDLKRLPHLLIAGTTGSGKSVCVNSIITSLIYNYDPNYLRFILVDPKMVELQLYNGLPHLLTPVIVDPQVAPMVLKWTMHEMERRYSLLSAINTRDIERFNDKVSHMKDGTEQLPYIVVIIDEMADLMMSSKEVEGYITRIAQKSRAVGIHLVVATQRPSVDIITGLIKANFPARIAFQVAQKTDSRTIIDQNGAEKLLGRGDMLYQSPTSSFPIRIQGGFVSEEEIEKIATHLCKLGKPSYIDIEESLIEEEESKELDEASDELFQEALKIIEETKKASASYLQRRLSIGYNRAARIIEQMEDMGYIGPQIGSKPREVFV